MSKLLKVVFSELTIRRKLWLFTKTRTYPVYNIYHGELDDEEVIAETTLRIRSRVEIIQGATILKLVSNVMNLSDDKGQAWMVHNFD